MGKFLVRGACKICGSKRDFFRINQNSGDKKAAQNEEKIYTKIAAMKKSSQYCVRAEIVTYNNKMAQHDDENGETTDAIKSRKVFEIWR